MELDEGVELLDSFLTLEELSSVWLDEVADFSEELIGVSMIEDDVIEEELLNISAELLNFSAGLLN